MRNVIARCGIQNETVSIRISRACLQFTVYRLACQPSREGAFDIFDGDHGAADDGAAGGSFFERDNLG